MLKWAIAMVGVLAMLGGAGAGKPRSIETPHNLKTLLAQGSASGLYLMGGLAVSHHDYPTLDGTLNRLASWKSAETLQLNMGVLRSRLFASALHQGDFKAALRQAEASPEPDDLSQIFLALDAFKRKRSVSLAPLEEHIFFRHLKPVLEAWQHQRDGDIDAALRTLGSMNYAGNLLPIMRKQTALIHMSAGQYAEAALALTDSAKNELALEFLRLYAHIAAQSGSGVYTTQALELLNQRLQQDPLAMDAAQLRELIQRGEVPALAREGQWALYGVADSIVQLSTTLLLQAPHEALVYGRLAQFVAPDHVEAILRVGALLAEYEQYDAAQAALETILKGSPSYWYARLEIGRYQTLKGDTESALAYYQGLQGSMPYYAAFQDELWTRIGFLYRRMEMYDRAIEVYDRILEQAQGYEQRHWFVFFARCVAHEQNDQWSEAEKDCIQSLVLYPGQPRVLNYLGYGWIDRGEKLDKALKMLETAYSADPASGHIVDSLAWGHYRLGNYADAVTFQEQAILLLPGDPILNDHLGDIYWRLGRKTEARYQWQRVLTLEPDEELAGHVEAKLEKGL